MPVDDRRRSVALYSPGWPPTHVQNGIVTYVGNIRPGFARIGLESHVLTDRVVASTADQPAIDMSALPKPRLRTAFVRATERLPRFDWRGLSFGWAVAQALTELRRRHGVDLVEMEETYGAAWYTQQMVDVPVVVRLHGPHFLNGAALGLPRDAEFRVIDRAERRCISEAAAVTAPSQDVLTRVRAWHEIELPDARVIPLPIAQIPAERRWRLESCDGRTILFVGRFDRHKGGDLAIDAFRLVADALPKAELVFVGPDRGLRDDAGNVQSLATYLEAKLPPPTRARVHVLGALPADRIETLRRQARVVIAPSRYETFCLALAEALAMGCPTVGADAGAMPEVLLDEKTGLLCKAGDAGDLAAKILTLFNHPERAAELGGQAAIDMRRLAPESIARITLDYYETLWDAPSRTGARGRVARALYGLTGLV